MLQYIFILPDNCPTFLRIRMEYLYKSLLVLVFLNPIVLVAQSNIEEYKSNLDEGIGLLQKGNNLQAEQNFDAVINTYRSDEQQFSRQLYLGNGLSQEQMDSFVTKSIYYSRASFFKGILLLDKNMPYDAIVHFSNSLELDSTFTDGYAGLADAYLAVHKYPKAVKLYTYALSLDPENIYLHLKKASVLNSLKMHDLAIESIDQALALDATCEACYPNRGYYKLLSEDYEGAIKDFDETLNVEPNDAYTLNNKGFALHKLGKTKEGLQLIDLSISILPDNYYAFLNRALLYNDINQKVKACDDYKSAISMGLEPEFDDRSNVLSENCN